MAPPIPSRAPGRLASCTTRPSRCFPAVVEYFKLEEVVLFGHSDGASIAVIYAGALSGVRGPQDPPPGPVSVAALVLEAPHVFVEPICTGRNRANRRGIRDDAPAGRLARYHGANTDSMFRTWTDVWLKPEFARWNIESACGHPEPDTVVQGEDDEYGTPAQVDAVLRQVRGPAQALCCRAAAHPPHATGADEVLEAASRFIREALRFGP